MSFGFILLIVVAILVTFGVGQRALDRLRLTDKQAMLFVALIIIGGVIPDIQLTPLFAFNIGGALVPLGLSIFLLIRAESAWEKWRAVIAAVLAGAAVFALGRFLPAEPEFTQIDPNYLYGISAAVVAYALGRSRRASFIAGTCGVLLADTAQAVINWSQGIDQTLVLGGAGAFDAVVIAGILGVLLSELFGEVIERITRGARREEEKGK
jgi:uncharacterized membrane protein